MQVAFLGQATSVITPVLVALSGQVVPLAVWLACCCGVAGGILVATDTPAQHAAETHRQLVMLLTPDARTLLAPPHLLFPPEGVADMASGAVAHSASVAGLGLPESDSAGAETNLLGMLCVLGSCVFYSLATVRMGVHSLRFGAIDLSGGSALTFSGLALLWLLAEYLAPVPQHQSMLQKGGSDVLLGGHVTLAAQLSALMADRGAQVVCLWAGLGPGALSSVMQAVGQRRVPPAQAQVSLC